MTPESRLADYQEEAETLATDLVDAIPADLRDGDADTSSEAREGENPSAQEQPGDVMWWDVKTSVPLVSEPDASASAADAVSASLEGDGWTKSRVREVNGGATIIDGFRKGAEAAEWYVEVTWVTSVEGKAELFALHIVSPPTTRG